MQPLPLHDEDWEYVRTLLPSDLEESARKNNALLRCRNVPDAAALIRMALAYALSDLSLKDVAAWASALDVAQITGPGLFYRLRESEGWLEHVLGRVLAEQVPQAAGGWPVRVVDATVINGPGKKPVQWRAHVQIDPATGGFRAVELTDDSGGEKLSRHRFRAGEAVLWEIAPTPLHGESMPSERPEPMSSLALIRVTCAPAIRSASASIWPRRRPKSPTWGLWNIIC